MFRPHHIIIFAICAIFLAACATKPGSSGGLASYDDANDPLEPLNRYFYDITFFGDTLVLRPLARIYDDLAPAPVYYGVGNVFGNLGEPFTFLNDVLQGEWARAGTSLARFIVNSTFGIAGLFDIASEIGLSSHSENFDQTLGVYGVPEGPYIFIPFSGPSTLRGVFASSAGGYSFRWYDPVDYVTSDTFWDSDKGILARSGVRLVHARAGFIGADLELQKAIDPYITAREFYRQSLRRSVRNGRPDDSVLPELDDEGFDFFDDEEE